MDDTANPNSNILSDEERFRLGLPWPGTYPHEMIEMPVALPHPVTMDEPSPVMPLIYRRFQRRRVRDGGMLTWRWEEKPPAF